MKREERSKALEALKYDPRCEVLLVSLKAGGVGLNLTAAQRVILMDPCWYVSSFLRGFPDIFGCVLLNSMLIFFLCVLWVIHRNPAVENQAVDRIVSFHLFSFQMNEEENYRRMKKKSIISYMHFFLLSYSIGWVKQNPFLRQSSSFHVPLKKICSRFKPERTNLQILHSVRGRKLNLWDSVWRNSKSFSIEIPLPHATTIPSPPPLLLCFQIYTHECSFEYYTCFRTCFLS